MDRKELLNQLDQLSNKHCKSCPLKAGDIPVACKSCPIYSDIRLIGEKLIKISTKRRKRKGLIKPKSKPKNMLKKPRKKRTGPNISIEQYLAFKKQKLTDEMISQKIGATRSQISHFKQQNGLRKKQGGEHVGF